MINKKARRRETSREGRKFNSEKGKKRTRKRNKKEKYHHDIMVMMILVVVVVVVVVVIEVRIKGCNKVEFMAPKGSETRTSLTSFFYLTFT